VEAAIVPMNMTPSSDLVSTACLKKKDVQTKSSKHKRGWMDKKRKFAKKGSKKNDKGSVVCISTKKTLFVFNCKKCSVVCNFYSLLLKGTRNIRIGTRNYSCTGYAS
jgi:ferredoxin